MRRPIKHSWPRDNVVEGEIFADDHWCVGPDIAVDEEGLQEDKKNSARYSPRKTIRFEADFTSIYNMDGTFYF